MSIIIFIAFMGVVVAMETASERRYITRFFCKAKEIFAKAKEVFIITYASVLYWTGVI